MEGASEPGGAVAGGIPGKAGSWHGTAIGIGAKVEEERCEKSGGAGSGITRRPKPRKFKGVRQRNGKWIAEIKSKGLKRRQWLGTYDSSEEAALAYDQKAREWRGQNARTNFGLPDSSVSPVMVAGLNASASSPATGQCNRALPSPPIPFCATAGAPMHTGKESLPESTVPYSVLRAQRAELAILKADGRHLQSGCNQEMEEGGWMTEADGMAQGYAVWPSFVEPHLWTKDSGIGAMQDPRGRGWVHQYPSDALTMTGSPMLGSEQQRALEGWMVQPKAFGVAVGHTPGHQDRQTEGDGRQGLGAESGQLATRASSLESAKHGMQGKAGKSSSFLGSVAALAELTLDNLHATGCCSRHLREEDDWVSLPEEEDPGPLAALANLPCRVFADFSGLWDHIGKKRMQEPLPETQPRPVAGCLEEALDDGLLAGHEGGLHVSAINVVGAQVVADADSWVQVSGGADPEGQWPPHVHASVLGQLQADSRVHRPGSPALFYQVADLHLLPGHGRPNHRDVDGPPAAPALDPGALVPFQTSPFLTDPSPLLLHPCDFLPPTPFSSQYPPLPPASGYPSLHFSALSPPLYPRAMLASSPLAREGTLLGQPRFPGHRSGGPQGAAVETAAAAGGQLDLGLAQTDLGRCMPAGPPISGNSNPLLTQPGVFALRSDVGTQAAAIGHMEFGLDPAVLEQGGPLSASGTLQLHPGGFLMQRGAGTQASAVGHLEFGLEPAAFEHGVPGSGPLPRRDPLPGFLVPPRGGGAAAGPLDLGPAPQGAARGAPGCQPIFANNSLLLTQPGVFPQNGAGTPAVPGRHADLDLEPIEFGDEGEPGSPPLSFWVEELAEAQHMEPTSDCEMGEYDHLLDPLPATAACQLAPVPRTATLAMY